MSEFWEPKIKVCRVDIENLLENFCVGSPNFGEVINILTYLFTNLLFLTYIQQLIRTIIYLILIFKFNYKIILPHQMLEKYHHIFTHYIDSPLHCIFLYLSNLHLYNKPHPNIYLDQILLLHIHHSCDNM